MKVYPYLNPTEAPGYQQHRTPNTERLNKDTDETLV